MLSGLVLHATQTTLCTSRLASPRARGRRPTSTYTLTSRNRAAGKHLLLPFLYLLSLILLVLPAHFTQLSNDIAFLLAPIQPAAAFTMARPTTRSRTRSKVAVASKLNQAAANNNRKPVIEGRVELFFKDTEELKERVQWLSDHGVKSFNLVNKHQKDTVDQWVKTIQQVIPDADICAHYSLKYNKVPRRAADAHTARWNEFWKSTTATEVLMITGSGGKDRMWNTASVVQQFTARKGQIAKLAVAYNPYFPYPKDRLQELNKLEMKLTSRCVDKVYLQFGTDLVALKQALELLASKQRQMQPGRSLAIAGSIFLPTAKLIAQQKFRPWNGVFLSPDFLSGPEHATQIVVEMLKLYEQYGVEVLWEAPGIRNDKDLAMAQSLQRQLSSNESSADSISVSANPTLPPLGGGASDGDGNSNGSDSDSDGDRGYGAADETAPAKRPRVGQAPLASNAGRNNARLANAARIKSKNMEKEISMDDAVRQSDTTCVLLFGTHDIRLYDNRAVHAAASRHKTVVPVFLWDPQSTHVLGALQVVVKDALRSLEAALHPFGLKLVCRNCSNSETATAADELAQIAESVGATHVYWNKGHSTETRQAEQERRRRLTETGLEIQETQSSLLFDPDTISLSKGFHGGHWGTLMPFMKNCLKTHGEPPKPIPKHKTFGKLQAIVGPSIWPRSDGIDGLLMAVMPPKTDWNKPILDRFPMSEESAKKTLESFFKKGFPKYEKERSRADKEWATSNLSVHLRVGTLSPYELYWRVKSTTLAYGEIKTFSRRLIWRDLAYFQLHCFPDMRYVSIRKHYENTQWVTGDEERRRLEAWKWGKTGFPIVDAGMRELYATGWMTQNVRMVVASFLVEFLRVNWVKGCEWFHYTLVDADDAINPMMWQNAGRSGIDQWNFILSPETASQDPTGKYTRRWVPELAKLPTKNLVHRPWEAPKQVLAEAGVVLGETYPHRVITALKAERAKSVAAVLAMRGQAQDANSDRGYDMVKLPNGQSTVVFTKKEYRIDEFGNSLREPPRGAGAGGVESEAGSNVRSKSGSKAKKSAKARRARR